MDWNHVTAQEVFSALREVEWREAPRPLAEFLQPARFSLPRTQKRWSARVKNNVYYYRVNYSLVILLCICCSLLRRPFALLAIADSALALLCLNDTFATSLSDTAMRGLRRVNVRLAQRIRAAAGGHSGIGHAGDLPGSRKSGVKICGVPRWWIVAALGVLGIILLQRSKALLTLAWSQTLGTVLVVVHATFRSPNLKARLGSAREEFRALWRGYQQQDAIIDYTL